MCSGHTTVTGGQLLFAQAFQLMLGGGLLLLSGWARRNVEVLVPAYLAPRERQRRGGTLLRGAWCCRALGWLLIVSALLPFVL